MIAFDVKASAKNNSKKLAKDDPKNAFDETLFPMSLGGLDRARKAVRFQMVRICNEVRA